VNTIVQVSTHSLTHSLTYLLTYLLTCYPAEQDRLKRIKLQEEKIANEKAEEDRKQADELQKAINFSNELGDFTSFFTHLLAYSLTRLPSYLLTHLISERIVNS
jgi:hypothetical protein